MTIDSPYLPPDELARATPKPRAGEHTETDEVNEQCAAIGGETISNLRNNFAVMRQHARNLEAERDQLRAREAELVDALRSITSGLADHLKAGTVRCDSCASEVANAKAALSKVRGA